MSDFLWPYRLQHTRPPCPSPTPRDCSNSCPLRQWCHSTISSSVVPFSSCLQSFPASRSFPMSQFYASSGQSIGVSASVLPMNIQGWFPWGLTGLISLLSKGLSRVFSSTTVRKHQFLSAQPSLWFNTHISLWPRGWQHTRLPCPSTNSRSLLKLISFESVMPSNYLIFCNPLVLIFSIFPSIRVFSKSWLFTSGGQNIGASASASVLPMTIQDWYLLGLNPLISLLSKGLSIVFSSTTVQKHQFFSAQPSLWSKSHIHTWLPEKL